MLRGFSLEPRICQPLSAQLVLEQAAVRVSANGRPNAAMLADKLGGSNPFHSLEARRNVVRQLQVMTCRRRLARGADYPGSPITARARTHSWTSASSQATACVQSRLADLEPRSWKEQRGAARRASYSGPPSVTTSRSGWSIASGSGDDDRDDAGVVATGDSL
jgi:hypothetical protein